MTSTLEKYSQIKSTTRSFCPLILYHDKPSKQLSINLNVNQHNNRTAIDRHRDKTNEMLEHNAQLWTMMAPNVGLASEAVIMDDDEADDYLDKDIKVSPSTSTTSNINSSSSTSGESIATLDHAYHHRSSPRVAEQGYYPKEIDYYPPLKMTNKPLPQQQQQQQQTKKRRRGNLPKEVTEFLRKWLIQHKKHPYPAEKEKADLARHTGLTVNQISNWFINARRRILQPMLESENLTAQMMAYPDLLHSPSAGGPSSSFLESSTSQQQRRRRHDFYTYQRDFNHQYSTMDHSPPPPPSSNSSSAMMHHHHQQMPHYQYPMEAVYTRSSNTAMMIDPPHFNNNDNNNNNIMR